MKLVPNWKKILTRSWSVRMTAVVALLNIFDVAISYHSTGHAAPAVMVAVLLSLGVAVARIIIQDDLHESYFNAP